MSQYVYQRTPSFFNTPIVSSAEQLRGLDVVILGFPWEGSVTWGQFTGVDLAPRTIRSASVRYSGFLPELDIDIFENLNVCDYRDVDVVPGDAHESFNRLSNKLRDIYNAGAFPIVIGGDHGSSYPVVKTLSEYTDGKIGVIHFDAHYDNKPDFEEDNLARCCPLRRIAELDKVKTTSIVHVGIRGARNTKAQHEYAKSIGATTFTSFDIRQQGIESVIEAAYKLASEGTDKIYVTVCSDALDIAYNPGGPPDPNGMTSMELSIALYKLAALGIHGFDLVEIYPPGDPNNVASHTGAWLLQYVMAGLARRKKDLTGTAK